MIDHGHTAEGVISPTYGSWRNMINRCYYPVHAQYKDYGGKGIKVYRPWRSSFSRFLKDVGPRPEGTTLDRFDKKKNYVPGNCRWATPKEQAREKVLWVEVDGVPVNVPERCAELGLTRAAFNVRLKLGWSVKEALTKPKRGKN